MVSPPSGTADLSHADLLEPARQRAASAVSDLDRIRTVFAQARELEFAELEKHLPSLELLARLQSLTIEQTRRMHTAKALVDEAERAVRRHEVGARLSRMRLRSQEDEAKALRLEAEARELDENAAAARMQSLVLKAELESVAVEWERLGGLITSNVLVTP